MKPRKKKSNSARISAMKNKAHRMLQKEGILQTKMSLLGNKAAKLREQIIKVQQAFRKLEAEEGL